MNVGTSSLVRLSVLLPPWSLAVSRSVIDGVYTHLPLKRARYGTDPVQRLRILRSQVDELTDEAFHLELADLVTRLRDAHTRDAGPVTLANKVAALPFLVGMIGTMLTLSARLIDGSMVEAI